MQRDCKPSLHTMSLSSDNSYCVFIAFAARYPYSNPFAAGHELIFHYALRVLFPSTANPFPPLLSLSLSLAVIFLVLSTDARAHSLEYVAGNSAKVMANCMQRSHGS